MTRREQNCPLAGLAPKFENSSLEFPRGVVVVIVGLSVAIREFPTYCRETSHPKQKGRISAALLVELPGIEPGSYGIPSRLLRAQSAMSLLGSPDHANKSG